MSTDRPAHLYDSIGIEYDTTRRADPYIAGRLAHHLALSKGGTYLDLACGSGNYTNALSARAGRWYSFRYRRRPRLANPDWTASARVLAAPNGLSR